MVIEVSSLPGDSKRIFFGLKSDGNYLFNEDETHQHIMISSNQEGNDDNKRQYAENFCVQIKEGGSTKEYIVSIANKDQYLELYDFENNQIHQIKSSEVIGHKINSIRHSSSHLINGSEKYIVFLSWIYGSNGGNDYNSFLTKLLKFNSKNIEQKNSINKINEVEYQLSKTEIETSVITSCFVSKSNYIWTMGFINELALKVPELPFYNVSYYIYVYSLSHMDEPIDSFYFNVYPFYNRTFCQLAYLRDDIGVAFYYSWPDYNIEVAYPSFYIAKFENNIISNYLDYYTDPITVNLD